MLDSRLLSLYARFGLQSNPVVSVKLFLQLNDCLVSLVEATRECNHDISLLQQELLVAVHLGLPLLNLSPLALNLIQFRLVLLPYTLLLFLQRRPELRSVFDFLTAGQNLRIHCFDFLLQQSFLLLRLQKLV